MSEREEQASGRPPAGQTSDRTDTGNEIPTTPDALVTNAVMDAAAQFALDPGARPFIRRAVPALVAVFVLGLVVVLGLSLTNGAGPRFGPPGLFLTGFILGPAVAVVFGRQLGGSLWQLVHGDRYDAVVGGASACACLAGVTVLYVFGVESLDAWKWQGGVLLAPVLLGTGAAALGVVVEYATRNLPDAEPEPGTTREPGRPENDDTT